MMCCYEVFAAWFSIFDFDIGQCLQAKHVWFIAFVITAGPHALQPYGESTLHIICLMVSTPSLRRRSVLSPLNLISLNRTMDVLFFIWPQPRKTWGRNNYRWFKQQTLDGLQPRKPYQWLEAKNNSLCHIILIKTAKPRYRAMPCTCKSS